MTEEKTELAMSLTLLAMTKGQTFRSVRLFFPLPRREEGWADIQRGFTPAGIWGMGEGKVRVNFVQV